MNDKVLLISGPGHDDLVEDCALEFCMLHSCGLVVLQLVGSHLYHYGCNDVVVPSYARTQFLFHVYEEELKKAKEREEALELKAAELGIDLRVLTMPDDDAADFVLRESQKGYRIIFMPRQKRKRFPLIGSRTLEERLKRKGLRNVVAC